MEFMYFFLSLSLFYLCDVHQRMVHRRYCVGAPSKSNQLSTLKTTQRFGFQPAERT